MVNRGRRRAVVALITLAAATRARAQQRLNTAMHASACEHLATLAERIAKSHVQIAEGVLAERSRRTLRDGVAEFDALLPLAGGLAGDAEARDNFVLLRLLWKELRLWTRKAPTREHARQVSDRAEEVSWVASKTARVLRTDGTSQREGLAAMQAATAAQRVGRMLLLKRLVARDARRDADLVDATARLGSMLAALAGSPHTLELEDDLRMAGVQYGFLLDAVRDSSGSDTAATAELVAKTTDHITDSMERAARLYENDAG
jgi:hypothetical protein